MIEEPSTECGTVIAQSMIVVVLIKKLRMQARAHAGQFSSAAQSCLTLCEPTDCSTPDFPVHHQLLEPAQTRVHQVNDASENPMQLWAYHTGMNLI